MQTSVPPALSRAPHCSRPRAPATSGRDDILRPMRRAAALAVMATLAGCRSSATIGTWPSAPVILVSIDTLRADHLSCYGYTAGSTTALAALARESVVFETAYTQCPLTLPSHASLFTGLLPAKTGIRDNMGFRLQGSAKTLAERFKAGGLAHGRRGVGLPPAAGDRPRTRFRFLRGQGRRRRERKTHSARCSATGAPPWRHSRVG